MDELLKKIDCGEEFVEIADEDLMDDSDESNNEVKLPESIIQDVRTKLIYLSTNNPEVLDEVLKTLTVKEEKIVRVSCGLDGTVDAFLGKYGISSEEFSIVLQKAIRRLKHPARMKKIEEAINKEKQA